MLLGEESILKSLSKVMNVPVELNEERQLCIRTTRDLAPLVQDPIEEGELANFAAGFIAGVKNAKKVRRICAYEGCLETAGRGRYCRLHKEIAKAEFEELVNEQVREREMKFERFGVLLEEIRGLVKKNGPVPKDLGGIDRDSFLIIKPGQASFPRWLKDNGKGLSMRKTYNKAGVMLEPPKGLTPAKQFQWAKKATEKLQGEDLGITIEHEWR